MGGWPLDVRLKMKTQNDLAENYSIVGWVCVNWKSLKQKKPKLRHVLIPTCLFAVFVLVDAVRLGVVAEHQKAPFSVEHVKGPRTWVGHMKRNLLPTFGIYAVVGFMFSLRRSSSAKLTTQ